MQLLHEAEPITGDLQHLADADCVGGGNDGRIENHHIGLDGEFRYSEVRIPQQAHECDTVNNHCAQTFERDFPTMRIQNLVQAEYNLSFTAASLRPELARIVAECYLKVSNWDLVRDHVLRSNALQCRSKSSAIRLERELRRRLGKLTETELVILAGENADDRAAIAWLATLKHTQLAFDFAAEVLREKLAMQDRVLRRSDYEAFVYSKSFIHPSLNRLRPSSRSKIRQVLLLMLSEAGLLGGGAALRTIQRPLLSPSVLRAIKADRPRWLAGFLFSDAEIGGE